MLATVLTIHAATASSWPPDFSPANCCNDKRAARLVKLIATAAVRVDAPVPAEFFIQAFGSGRLVLKRHHHPRQRCRPAGRKENWTRSSPRSRDDDRPDIIRRQPLKAIG